MGGAGTGGAAMIGEGSAAGGISIGTVRRRNESDPNAEPMRWRRRALGSSSTRAASAAAAAASAAAATSAGLRVHLEESRTTMSGSSPMAWAYARLKARRKSPTANPKRRHAPAPRGAGA